MKRSYVGLALFEVGLFAWVCTAAIVPAIAATQSIGESCSKSQVRQAQLESDQLKDWEAVYTSFARFAHCSQPQISEGYSYSVGHLLARDWQHIESLLQLSASHPTFADFVVQHIDENIPEEDAQLLVRNAREHCPTAGKWLCRAISSR
jgi:hypothetical protein